jgi:hypothetical protein
MPLTGPQKTVAEARAANPGLSWRELAGSLGMGKDEAYGHYRRLMAAARAREREAG